MLMTDPAAYMAGEFFDLLWGNREGYAEIRSIKDKKVSQSFFPWPSSRENALAELAIRASSDVFSGVLLRTDLIGDAAHCEKETEWLWVDVDKKRGATFSSILKNVVLDPQIVVDSGHGWHLYWHLDKPVLITLASSAMKILADAMTGDPVGDAARIMRIPGTLNFKGDSPLPVRLLKIDRLSKNDFSNFEITFDRREPVEYTDGEVWTLSNEDAPKFGEGQRNHGLTTLAGAMLRKGMDSWEILESLRAENEVRCEPPLADKELQTISRSIMRYK